MDQEGHRARLGAEIEEWKMSLTLIRGDSMILPIDPDPPIAKEEFIETLIGLAMIAKAREYGIEGDLQDLAEFVRLELD